MAGAWLPPRSISPSMKSKHWEDIGNPRRFQSQDVVRMEPGPRSRSQPIDGPLEEIETEGHRHLQTLVNKQLDTNVTVQQQLGQKREFSLGAEFTASTDELMGIRSLADFLDVSGVDAYIEEMKSYGLTHEEILYKLQSEETNKKSRLSNPDYHEAKMKEIDDKIARKKEALQQPDQFSNRKSISRHEMDLEKAISLGNTQNRFLHKTLVAQKNKTSEKYNDPMNAIQDILETLTSTSKRISSCSRSRRNKADKHAYKAGCTLECCKPVDPPVCEECESPCVSSASCSTCHHQLTVATCMEKPDNYTSFSKVESMVQNMVEAKIPVKSSDYVVRSSSPNNSKTATSSLNSGAVREIEQVEAIPESVVQKYKLTPAQVKEIPTFANYTPGEPNNVLFVKNLSFKVTEEDLASLFMGFQSDTKIIFKLLNGKMKGQAFITFPDTETASRALDLVHGYPLKDRPVVVQFEIRNLRESGITSLQYY